MTTGIQFQNWHTNMLEFTEKLLFSPIVIAQSHINVTADWIQSVKDWGLTEGKYSESGNLTSTFSSNIEAHNVDWIYSVLEQIAPKEYFVSSWVQIYESGGFHPIHNHSGEVDVKTSGCLFLSEGSSTYFQDPLHRNQTNCNPNVSPGDVILWDPELYHFSPPVKTERIVLAFNLNE